MKKLSLLLTMLILFSCNTKPKKDSNLDKTTSEVTNVETNTIEEQNSQQDGNYEELYSLKEDCKITIEELATLYGITSSELNSRIELQRDCRYLIKLKDGTETIFYVKNINRPKDVVQSEINRALKNSFEKDFIQKTNTGGHYIYKHPNQGWLLLSNPAYDNAIKIQYRAMLTPGLDQTQKEYREQKGYQVADYLIAKYEK